MIDLDLRGTAAEIVTRFTDHGELEALATARRELADSSIRSRGRPKLGVVAREVTLLPRHWEWLATQPGEPRGRCAALLTKRVVQMAARPIAKPHMSARIASCLG
uniref:DUF2239 family protein n=1 Tax=Sphingomonas sp. H160509 TaxID=2955313 RepID=UPI003158CB64